MGMWGTFEYRHGGWAKAAFEGTPSTTFGWVMDDEGSVSGFLSCEAEEAESHQDTLFRTLRLVRNRFPLFGRFGYVQLTGSELSYEVVGEFGPPAEVTPLGADHLVTVSETWVGRTAELDLDGEEPDYTDPLVRLLVSALYLVETGTVRAIDSPEEPNTVEVTGDVADL